MPTDVAAALADKDHRCRRADAQQADEEAAHDQDDLPPDARYRMNRASFEALRWPT